MTTTTTPKTVLTRSALLATALSALALTAACSSSSDAGGPTTAPASSPVTRTATATRTETATAGNGDNGIASGEPNPAASSGGTGQCQESQLKASIDPRHVPGNGTAGSDGKRVHGVLVDFENTSGSTCTLFGYPGAAIADSSGKQVQQATRTLRGALGGLPSSQSKPSTVTLRPGAYAAAFVEGVDTREQGAAQAGCDGPKYPRILITPPNTDTAVPFTTGWPLCYSFTVHPVQALPSKP